MREREAVQASWTSLDQALSRRAEMVPTLTASLKGLATHDEPLLQEIERVRQSTASAQSPAERLKANNELTASLSRLLVATEKYPTLTSNEAFNHALTQLAGAEAKISQERRKYNSVAERYNTDIQLFPKNIVASLMGFLAEPYYQTDSLPPGSVPARE